MSETLSDHQQLSHEFNDVAETAKQADELIGSVPRDHKGIYHTQLNGGGQHESMGRFAKGDLNAEVVKAFDGKQIRAHVSEPDLLKGGRMVDSHSFEASGGEPAWMLKDREGTHTRLFTHDKEGNLKKLESDNPLVAKMVTRIALKSIEQDAQSQIVNQNEKKAA